MKYLALDISSSTIGWAITSGSNLLYYGYIKPKDSKYSLEERLDSAVDEITKIYKEHKPDKIIIEELAQYMSGASTAKTILMLATFNRVISYSLYKLTNESPEKLMPTTARKYIRKFLKLDTRLSKEDVYKEVKKQFKNFVPEVKKGKEIKENMDIADAIAISWAWSLKCGA